MADTIKVRAVPGLLCPVAPPKSGFVGWERATSADDADYAVPGGVSYKLVAGGVDVPDSAYYRRALKRGDIVAVGAETNLPRGVADEGEV